MNGVDPVELSLFPLNICKFLLIFVRHKLKLLLWTDRKLYTFKVSISRLNKFIENLFPGKATITNYLQRFQLLFWVIWNQSME